MVLLNWVLFRLGHSIRVLFRLGDSIRVLFRLGDSIRVFFRLGDSTIPSKPVISNKTRNSKLPRPVTRPRKEDGGRPKKEDDGGRAEKKAPQNAGMFFSSHSCLFCADLFS